MAGHIGAGGGLVLLKLLLMQKFACPFQGEGLQSSNSTNHELFRRALEKSLRAFLKKEMQLHSVNLSQCNDQDDQQTFEKLNACKKEKASKYRCFLAVHRQLNRTHCH